MKQNMKYILTIFALIFVAGVVYTPQSASATANTKVDLFQDRSAGGVEAIDMVGPAGFGFLNFNQTNDGDLRLLVVLKNAEPNTTYEGAFLACGPDHSSACDFVDVGELTTNTQGNGTAIMHLSVETLQASPFGPGARTDHFDMIGPDGDIYAAGGVNYLVP